jgi:hypothetical protein
MLKTVYFNPDNLRGKYMKPPTRIKSTMECRPEASPKPILPYRLLKQLSGLLIIGLQNKESNKQMEFHHKT